MQIKCSKDIGGWFDELSIINVKINIKDGLTKDKSILNFKNLEHEIKDQIGGKLFDEIIISNEYKELYQLNKKIFDYIDDLREKSKKEFMEYKDLALLGIEIDELNTARFISKNNLQKKYFGSEIKEIKIGYNN